MAKRKPRQQHTRSPAAAQATAHTVPRFAWLRAASGVAFRPAAAIMLLAAALALYWGSLRHPLVFDDVVLHEGLLRDYGRAWFKLDLRWFAYASFGWTYDLVGQQWFWFRLGNVLLHALSGTILFLLMERLFRTVLSAQPVQPTHDSGLDPAWYAFFGALLFVLHPVAVYGAAYLVQRTILMATLFSLLSLYLFLEGLLRGARSGTAAGAWHAGAAGAFFIAAFSKEHCVMLPAVAIAIALLVRGASLRTLRELLLPGVLLGAIALLLILKKKGLLGAQYEPLAQAMVAQLSESQPAIDAGGNVYVRSVVNQAYLFFRYLMLWLLPWPGWMAIDLRPEFPARILSWPQIGGLLPWLAWPLIALWLLLQGGRRGLAGLAMLFPWLFALTEVATVRIQEPFVLYRSYLWMGGLAALLPAALGGLSKRAAALLLFCAVVALVPASLDRLQSFSNEERVWDDAVRKLPGDNAPLADRTYRARGVAAYRAERYDAALRDIDKALTLNAASAEAWMLRGMLLMRAGKTPDSLAALDRAIALNPGLSEAYARRCVVRMRLQRLDEALPDCEQVLRLDPTPDEPRHYISLGMVQALRNRPAEAEAAYRRALAIAPADDDAHYQYGLLLAGIGRMDEARPHLVHACKAGLEPACRRARQ